MNSEAQLPQSSRSSVNKLYVRLLVVSILVTGVIYLLFEETSQDIQGTEQARTQWYNEDLESVFGVHYLPRSIDDPANNSLVSQILNSHDIRTEKKYTEYREKSTSERKRWDTMVASEPISNDKRMYIASAGAKGHGVFAGRVLKAGEFLAEYTGIFVLDKEVRNSDYMWGYASKPIDKDGNTIGTIG
jgi:hypothetical protein